MPQIQFLKIFKVCMSEELLLYAGQARFEYMGGTSPPLINFYILFIPHGTDVRIENFQISKRI
jgi:hypothetical protein